MKIARAVVCFHTFAEQGGICAHADEFQGSVRDRQWYEGPESAHTISREIIVSLGKN
jgi:hypothetical protein